MILVLASFYLVAHLVGRPSFLGVVESFLLPESEAWETHLLSTREAWHHKQLTASGEMLTDRCVSIASLHDVVLRDSSPSFVAVSTPKKVVVDGQPLVVVLVRGR